MLPSRRVSGIIDKSASNHGFNGSPDGELAGEWARRGVRAWVRDAGGQAGRGLRGATTLCRMRTDDQGDLGDGAGFASRSAAEIRPSIDTGLVRRLVATQFPRWAGLPVRPVEFDGWDNRTFHLGDRMAVRLPSAEGYAAQVDKEHRWLPVLAPRLPLPVPVPLAKGAPAAGYPFNWSVYRWIDGDPAGPERIDDLTGFAATLAGFLTALRRVDPDGGPPPGRHSAFRGGPLTTYDAETRRTIEALGDRIPGDLATAAWEAALDAAWRGRPVWVHGDVAAGNLLVRDGKLVAVIDFGCSAVGDPACDMTIAWTLFSGDSRRAFRAAASVDPATWARGRGWALWKALITVAEHVDTDPARAAPARRVIDDVLDEFARSA
jgi:aminoglycoside phosphotransferase (APT) family kinase protein